MNSSCSESVRMNNSSPRLFVYGGGPTVAGRHVPYGSGYLPDDFTERLALLKNASGLTWQKFAEALGVEIKQVLRWLQGTEPSGGAYHCLVRFATWVPSGLDILMGEDFLIPLREEFDRA